MKTNNNKVLKASAWYMASSFLIKGIGFLTTPFFSRILTQEEYGLFNNFSTWLSLISVVASLSLISSLVRARFDYEDELNSFIASNLLLGVCSTLLVSAVLLAFGDRFSSLLSLDKKYIWMLCACMLASPAYDMFITVQRFRYRYKTVAFLAIFSSLISIALSFILICFMEDHLLARVIGCHLPGFCISFALLIRFIVKGGRFKFEYIRYSIPIAVPYIFHLLSGSILNSSDKIIITNVCGATSTALYSMSYSIAALVNLVWGSMNTAYSPWLGEKLNEKEYTKIKKSSYPYLTFFTLVVIGIMLVAPEFLYILGGQSYIEAKYSVPPLIAGAFFVFVYSMYVNVEQFEKKTIGMAVATCASALLNIGLNAVFVPKFGYIAAAYTTLASYIVLAIFHFCIVHRMKLTCVYNTGFNAGICCIVIIFSFLSLYLYAHSVLRYILIGIIAAAALLFAFRFRDKIKAFIKK